MSTSDYLKRENKYIREVDDFSSSATELVMTEAYRSVNRIRYVGILFLIVFMVFAWRLVSLQLSQGDVLLRKSEGNRLLMRKLPALRGNILDRNRKVLVENVPSYSLYYVGDNEVHLREIAQSLSLDYDTIKSVLSRGVYGGGIILPNLTPKEAIPLALKIAQYPSELLLIPQPQRHYVYPESGMSSTLGYLGKPSPHDPDAQQGGLYDFDDDIGKSGLEKYYNYLLMGVDGRVETEVDSVGRQKQEQRVVPPAQGNDIVLTVDLEMQKELSKALIQELKLRGKHAGVALAQDPTNGEILALVNYPDFDNNIFSQRGKGEEIASLLKDPDHPLFIRAVQGLYPSGSVIKPIVASAALEERLITRAFTVLSIGGIHVGDSYFPDWKQGGHGVTNVVKALAESVNTFFYIIGGGYQGIPGLGPERIQSYATRFGWGRTLGIDLQGEEKGFIPSPEWKLAVKKERWYLGDTYHLAIGQGDVLVTPLQVESMMSTIANGGTLYKPHLLRYALGLEKNPEHIVEPSIIYKDIIASSTLGIIREGLRATVEQGSARRLQSIPVEVSGKTGTAQTSKGSPHAWFTGFAPSTKPEIALTILIENGVEGSTTAVPVAEEFFKWYFTSYTHS